MSKNVQIRNVPDNIHRVLRTRAAAEGRSLSDYLLQELRRTAEKPTMAEWLQRVAQRPPLKTKVDLTAIIREERDRR